MRKIFVCSSWLTSHTTDAERFLLSLPCVNPFVAQLLLHLSNLKDICGLSTSAFMDQMSWLPRRIAQVLFCPPSLFFPMLYYMRPEYKMPRKRMHLRVCAQNAANRRGTEITFLASCINLISLLPSLRHQMPLHAFHF